MTRKALGALALRLMAIFLLLMAVAAMPSVFAFSGNESGVSGATRVFRYSTIAQIMLLLASGIALLLLANWLSAKILPEPEAAVTWPSAKVAPLTSAGVLLIGVWCLASGIPELLKTWLRFGSNQSAAEFFRRDYNGGTATVIVGVVLLLVAWGINYYAGKREQDRPE